MVISSIITFFLAIKNFEKPKIIVENFEQGSPYSTEALELVPGFLR